LIHAGFTCREAPAQAYRGYSVREELPIFLLTFLVPSAAALIVRWRFL